MLDQLPLTPPLTVPYLHQQILGSLKRWDPLLDADETTRIRGNPYEREKKRTPVYVKLNSLPQRSIQIAPLPAPTHDVGSWVATYPPGEAGNMCQTLDGLARSQETDARTEVLISVHFDLGEPLSITEIHDWILHMPLVAKAVTLHSIARRHSFLAIMEIPIAIWDLLPEGPTYSFVGFTTSSNLLLGTTWRGSPVSSRSPVSFGCDMYKSVDPPESPNPDVASESSEPALQNAPETAQAIEPTFRRSSSTLSCAGESDLTASSDDNRGRYKLAR